MTTPPLHPTPTARRYPHTPGRNWRLDGNCLAVELDTMHPHPSDLGGIAEAKAVCAGCPVQRQCLADAIEVGDWEGIRAGLTGPERRTHAGLTAARACIDCGTTYTPYTHLQKRCTTCSYTHNHRRGRR